MLKPTVQVHDVEGVLTAEFWDCLRLDPAPVQELRALYETHVRRGGHPVLVVDLSGVAFAGSASLGGFLAIHRQARQHGGRLIFCNVDPNVAEVFRVSKIEPLFTFTTDRPSALALARDPSEPADPPARPSSGPSPLRGRFRKD